MSKTVKATKAGPRAATSNPRKLNPDAILSVAAARTGNGTVVTANSGETLIRTAITKEFQTLARNGLSFKALKAYCDSNKPTAKLARGIGAGDAPHSAKAVSDAKPAAKAAKGKPAPKAAKAKQPSSGADRAYVKGKTANVAKPGTWRHHMLTVMLANKSTASAKEAHAASGQFPANKLDFNWANAQGYIVLK